MEEETKDLRDYLTAFRRRRKPLLATVAVLFLIAVAVAALLPSVYRSTATILIEQQEIPADLVRSTISSYADQRIQVISQQVMTRPNLMRIVEKYNLYPRYRASKTSEEILERLAKDIKLDMLKADVIDQRSGAKTTATIAFSLSYEGETPTVAQRVANELVTLFLSENLKNRQQKTTETSTFITEEAAKLSEHVSEIETKLAAFKAKNMGRLPELVSLNFQLRDRADNEIKELDRQISALEERKFYLDGQLAQMKPNTPLISASGERILDSDERLKALQAQYASLSGVYSSNHPDIVKMRREMESLRKETGGGADPQEQAKQLTRLRADLATAREKYSDDHPDIVKLKKSIAALEAEPSAPVTAKAAVKPENPAYIALKAQLEATLSDLKSSRSKRIALESKVASYDLRLEQTPQVEREYLDLTRDHETSLNRYREIKAKQMQAEIGQELEKDRKGERFSLIDPPQLPEKPSSPNRPAILLLGLVLSLGGGVGSAAALESMDESVRGSKDLTRLLRVPVLAVIPYMENNAERRRKRKVALLIVASLVAVLGLALLLVHSFLIPLDVLWFRALQWLQAYVPAVASISGAPLETMRTVWSA
jgi:succinoglycan biosynthesis transport protein ExoP